MRLAAADPSLYIPYLALGTSTPLVASLHKAEDSYSKRMRWLRETPGSGGWMNAAIEAHNLTWRGHG